MSKDNQEATRLSSTEANVRLADIWKQHFGERHIVGVSEAEEFFQEVNDDIIYNQMSVEDRKRYLKMIGVSPA